MSRAPAVWARCPVCGGRKYLWLRRNRRECGTCHGRGKVRAN